MPGGGRDSAMPGEVLGSGLGLGLVGFWNPWLCAHIISLWFHQQIRKGHGEVRILSPYKW